MFTAEGRLRDGGAKLWKKARSGGIDPSIRGEVWPFLLGVYDLNSTAAERSVIKVQKRKEYESLRRRCRQLRSHKYKGIELLGLGEFGKAESCCLEEIPELGSEGCSPRAIVSPGRADSHFGKPVYDTYCDLGVGEDDRIGITAMDASFGETESSGSESSVEEEPERTATSRAIEEILNHGAEEAKFISHKRDPSIRTTEDFDTWQRIIRLDAIRASAEWVIYSPSQAMVSDEKAEQYATAVGLKDYDHLEPCMVYHAARLVAVLEAYAIYDPEIGYCQGMSDLLSPILAIVEEDNEAFWCFVGFMRKARHNFRLDEAGIRRQLKIVAKIIQSKDSLLYRHLEELQAEDCFFVYRMVVVLFRRELTFEQTVCLWEVMWADQAAIRAGIRRSSWGRLRLRAPPTDDLLLYAIAASVLQKRKLIIEGSSCMDEIMRECNSMTGHLDVWRLLDDAHSLVNTLHDKVEE